MKKSTFWLILAIIWTIDAMWFIIRFFDVHVVVQNKRGALVKEVDLEAKKPTPLGFLNVILTGLLADLNWFHFFRARKKEQTAAKCGQETDEP